MTAIKASRVNGTQDFGQDDMLLRKHTFKIIEQNFMLAGFLPLETPALEKLDLLNHHYGEENSKLIFKILRSGDFLKHIPPEKKQSESPEMLSKLICDKALRYDLTVPLARYVAENIGKLHLPFRRYQMQPVWRADRPQKGRFREFYQCDADIIGSNSLWAEIELITLYDKVLSDLGLSNICIRINHRKLLFHICAHFQVEKQFRQIVTILDKLDKIGWDAVIDLWLKAKINKVTCNNLKRIFDKKFTDSESLRETFSIFSGLEKEIDEVCFIMKQLNAQPLTSCLWKLDLSLARGLDYYTGCIFEVESTDFSSSIGGGGRYDDLTQRFGLKNTPGIGISFGIERILLLIKAHQSEIIQPESKGVLFLNFGEIEAQRSFSILTQLRSQGVLCELYPEASKVKKQLHYANKRGFGYVAMIGSQEITENLLTFKDMREGGQTKIQLDENTSTQIANHIK